MSHASTVTPWGLLKKGVKLGDYVMVMEALSRGADPEASTGYALAKAAELGHGRIVRLLLPLVGPDVIDDSDAGMVALDNGHRDIADVIFNYMDDLSAPGKRPLETQEMPDADKRAKRV